MIVNFLEEYFVKKIKDDEKYKHFIDASIVETQDYISSNEYLIKTIEDIINAPDEDERMRNIFSLIYFVRIDSITRINKELIEELRKVGLSH